MGKEGRPSRPGSVRAEPLKVDRAALVALFWRKDRVTEDTLDEAMPRQLKGPRR